MGSLNSTGAQVEHFVTRTKYGHVVNKFCLQLLDVNGKSTRTSFLCRKSCPRGPRSGKSSSERLSCKRYLESNANDLLQNLIPNLTLLSTVPVPVNQILQGIAGLPLP